MGADAFAPWHIILLVVVLVLLFGSRRLPGAARSLGQSMHIFKKSVSGGYQDEDDASNPDNNASGFSASAFPLPPAAPAPAVQPPATPDATQAQLQDLQRQVAELQRQSASGDAGQSNQPF
jgi:sec-independent protein translocase protein TatA